MNTRKLQRRTFLKTGFAALLASVSACGAGLRRHKDLPPPNIVFILADQWRAQALGFTGNSDVLTPHLDRLADQSINFTTAVSGCPVCCPYRGSLITGQYWLTHGVIYNDKPLSNKATSMAQAFAAAGYHTGYIGKWHLNGHAKGETMAQGRTAFIPRERRQGFQFWKTAECTHNYNKSFYYGDTPEKKFWPGYDTIAQTREAQEYIQRQKDQGPFFLLLSWGPPHAPYHTAPQTYRDKYPNPGKLQIRPNVPEDLHPKTRETLAGYYAHIAALDDCVGDLLQTLQETGLEDNTIVVFTSDHGDMLYSHRGTKKQQPWDESILVPFLLRYPAALGKTARSIDAPINTPDIMPTLLGLGRVPVPFTCEGQDFSQALLDGEPLDSDAALIMCPVPFHQWGYKRGGREFRGIRTPRYTYVRDLKGPWLLYDNQQDPYQLKNLCQSPAHKGLQERLESTLQRKLDQQNDRFLSGPEYMAQWDYDWDPGDGPVG